jgi:hypothetical protein
MTFQTTIQFTFIDDTPDLVLTQETDFDYGELNELCELGLTEFIDEFAPDLDYDSVDSYVIWSTPIEE